MSAIDQTNAADRRHTSTSSASAAGRSASVPADPKTSSGTTGGFQTGQILKGEIIDLQNKDIKVRLEDTRVIQAKMEGPHAMSIGDQASFQVTSASNYKMVLKTLSTGYAVSQDHILEKALDEAALPHTARNFMAVKSLLENQLSINKASIQQLLKQAAVFQNASIETLVLMNKHHIPINPASSAQFEAYRNFEHRIINQLDSFLNNLITEDPSIETAGLLQDMLASGSTPAPRPSVDAMPVSSLLSKEGYQNLFDALDGPWLSIEDRNALLNGTASIHETVRMLSEAYHSISGVEPLELPSDPAAFFTKSQIPAELEGPEIETLRHLYQDAAGSSTAFLTFLSSPEREQLLDMLSPLHLPDAESHALLTGEISAKDLLELFEQYKSLPDADFGKFVQEPVYQSVLKELMLSHWTIDPNTLTEPDTIKEYYKRLDKELELLEQLEQKETDGFYKNTQDTFLQQKSGSGTASAIRENIDFMKTLNQIFTYLQMPVKLPSQNVHSELYVYTNKKALRQNKEHIKVLLHLDLQHLGSLDIHIEMHTKNIAAEFYMEQMDSSSIIHENLPILQQRLSEKGYLLSAGVYKKQKEIDIVNDFIAPKETGLDMKRYTFDIRA